MDYSKHGISKKQKQIRSNIPKAEKKIKYNLFRVFIFSFILIGVIGVGAAIGGIKGVIDSAPEIKISDISPKEFKSYIYYEDGELLQELVGVNSNRIYKDISEISPSLQNAFIALEDERFREHNGIDPTGMARAFVRGLTSGAFNEGASTITQQLLKLSVFSGGEEPSLLLRFKRKFQEQYLALNLEKELSKDEILEAYLNTINLGNGNYGVESASQYYFGKSCSEINHVEAAILASIAQSPTNNEPLYHVKTNQSRRNQTLEKMKTQGYISEAEYNEGIANDNIYTVIAENAQRAQAERNKVYTPYVDAVIRRLTKQFQQDFDLTKEAANAKIYSGGLKIYIAQDKAFQAVVDEEYANDSNFPTTHYLLDYTLSLKEPLNGDATQQHFDGNYLKQYTNKYLLFPKADPALVENAIQQFKADKGITEDMIAAEGERIRFVPQVQSSFVLIEQETGKVLALSPGRGAKETSLSFNRATDSVRQPGSTFKVVSTYAPALDLMGKSLSSTKVDKPYKIPYSTHTVNNVDRKYTNGPVTYRQAIISSKNTIATAVMVEEVTPEVAYEFLTQKLGFTTLDDVTDVVPALALGGITHGVTNLELTASFAAIANGGIYIDPVLYVKVLDSNDNIVIDNTIPKSHQAMRPTTAYYLTEAMKGVVQGGGTGPRANLGTITTAGKTGTSENRRDYWFVGYTPYYTAGIWFGYDNNVSITNYTSDLYAQQRLWKKLMTRFHEMTGKENKAFELPAGVVEKNVCATTGKLPGPSCTVRKEYFDPDYVPTETCTHVSAKVCSLCGGTATSLTPSENIITKQYESQSQIPSQTCHHVKTSDTDNSNNNNTNNSTNNNNTNNNNTNNNNTNNNNTNDNNTDNNNAGDDNNSVEQEPEE